MRVLLDTHLLLWSLAETRKLPLSARLVIESDDNVRLFSAVSIFEIAVKARLGRPDFAFDPKDILRLSRLAGFRELIVASAAAPRVAALPLHHRDPFDRFLVAQAAHDGAVLLTVDAALAAYGDHVLVLE